jgi:hypothetical protein
VRTLRCRRGYTTVFLFFALSLFVIFSGMHVLLLISVGTTSRAYDHYRQGATEQTRLQRAVNEAVLAQCEIAVAPAGTATPRAPAAELARQLANLNTGGATIVAQAQPATLPVPIMFPSGLGPPDALGAPSNDLQLAASPELLKLLGSRVAEYGALTYEFASTRTVLDQVRTYRSQVTARVVAVPLTRFAIAAYDLPGELGATGAGAAGLPASAQPAGLVPGRDPAFVPDLQAQAGTLPYHYRRRASLASAYQYVFSQQYIDRAAEYAGVTHFCDLDAAAGSTAQLDGMTRVAGGAQWDLGLAGGGKYTTITQTKEVAVVFTRLAGRTLTLYDSVGDPNSFPLLLVLAGPSDASVGPLTVDIAAVTRPVLIIGYNLRVMAEPNASLRGALLLDPASALPATGNSLNVAHLSYWAGTSTVAATAVTTGMTLPAGVEAMAPRVVYVASTATKL